MSFIVQIVVTLISWFALMFICTNLVGLLVRGFVANPELDDLVAENKILAQYHRSSERRANIIVAVLIIGFFWMLYFFWNVGLVIAGIVLMVSRVPDLMWEIKKGRESELEDTKKPKIFLLTTLLSWASMPVVWYSIYQM